MAALRSVLGGFSSGPLPDPDLLTNTCPWALQCCVAQLQECNNAGVQWAFRSTQQRASELQTLHFAEQKKKKKEKNTFILKKSQPHFL